MNKNNICKLFLGSVLISMILGGATRFISNRVDAAVAEAKYPTIATIAESVPEPQEGNDEVYTACNDIIDCIISRA